jgi:type I restriction enzyme M protein
MQFRTEREVEINLLKPLFEKVLGYPESDLEWARKISFTMGRDSYLKEADLIACHGGRPLIAVEAKRPTEAVRSALGQVDSYAFALQTPYSLVTNGKQILLRGYYSFNSRINIIEDDVTSLSDAGWDKLRSVIGFKNILSTIQEKSTEVGGPDEEKISDYRRYFRRLHNTIRDRDRLDPAAAFDELSKLLFLKAAEDGPRPDGQAGRAVLTPEKISEWDSLGKGQAQKFVNEWFKATTEQQFPGVFGDHPEIGLSPQTLKSVLSEMAPFHLKGDDVDVKGRAFEEFLPSQLRGKGLGQFFTPRPVVNFMVSMAAVSIQDVVLDFACGSGGFLIKAFEQMQTDIERLPAGTLARIGSSRERLLEDVRAQQIFGVDAEPRAARTAKMNMLMWGDGRRVVRGNGLDVVDFNGEPYALSEYDPTVEGSGCTLVLANPPFGSKEKDEEILARYDLGSRQKSKDSEKTEVLFIEKGLRALRPEGKMLIVLPSGLMSGSSANRVRDLILSQAEIRAIIELPTHAFVQSGVATINTCVVFIQKFTEEKKRLYDEVYGEMKASDIRKHMRANPDFDYQMFFAIAEHIGYEPSGRPTGAPGEETDLDLILSQFMSGEKISPPAGGAIAFAEKHYGEKSSRRRDQVVRGTTKGLDESFTLSFSETQERLDPWIYLFRSRAREILDQMAPLGNRITEVKDRFRPVTEDELDAEYNVVTVSSDGRVSLNAKMKGEELPSSSKKLKAGDLVYNPMRLNIGSIGVVPKELDEALASPDYVVARPVGISGEFLVTLMRSPFYKMYIDIVATGSIRDRFYFTDFQKLRVPSLNGDIELTVNATAVATGKAIEEAHAVGAVERGKLITLLHGLVHAREGRPLQ